MCTCTKIPPLAFISTAPVGVDTFSGSFYLKKTTTVPLVAGRIQINFCHITSDCQMPVS